MKIFIVDDEQVACAGLRGMIVNILGEDENEIHTFTSSMEALEQAGRLRPDIIFLDIVMPDMDGIEFTARVNEIYAPNIVIISGNDTYNYVRQCFKQNVRDYILKPIEFSELQNVLGKLQNDFMGGPPQAPDYDAFDYVFTAVVKGNEIDESFRREIEGIPAFYGLNTAVAVNAVKEQYNDIVFTFRLSDECQYTVCTDAFVSIFNSYATASNTVIKGAFSALFEKNEYEQARENVFSVFQSRFYSECSECYSTENRLVKNDNENPEFFKRLSQMTPFTVYEDAGEYNHFIAEWFLRAKLEKLPYQTIKRQYNSLISRIINSNMLEDDLEIKKFREFNTLDEIIFEVKCVADGIASYYLEKSQNDLNVVEQALNYIRDNYDKNITMATVSNHFNLNYSYFSRIFKEFAGTSFSQYILNLRMEKAKELLISNNDLKIGDIAQMVGYSNENVQNFTRAFKSYFGKPPKNYKN